MADSGRVLVITGLGGMGLAVARRLGSSATIVLADINPKTVETAVEVLRSDGYRAVGHVTDVSDAGSVASLAEAATDLGRVEVLVHTAGLSPVQAPVAAVLSVDLLGAALMLDAFSTAIAPGGAGVFIASMAGSMFLQEPDLERRLATTPSSELLSIPELSLDVVTDSGTAYGLAKRANQLRVRAASLLWGRRRARVNSISPGVISTPMGLAELDGESGEFMRSMIANSPTGRIGTPDDIAAAVEFLAGPESSFITGIDLLVDGGVVASLLSPGL